MFNINNHLLNSMSFDDRPALRLGFEQFKNSVELIKTDLQIEDHRAFETWTQRVLLKELLTKEGWGIEWPTEIEGSQAIGEGGGELKLDVGMIISKESEGDIDYQAVVCQCYYPEDPFNASGISQKSDEVDSAINNLTQPTPDNERRTDFLSELKEKHILYEDENEGDLVVNKGRVKGFFVTSAELPSNNAVASTIQGHKTSGTTVIGAIDIAKNEWLKLHPEAIDSPDEKTIQFEATVGDDVDGVALGIISARSLYHFFKEDRLDSPWHGGKNQSLLDDNLRFKLDSDTIATQISEGMKSTMAENPTDFIKYNNGIVIVAEGFEIDDKKILMTKPNIVNGGQTTNAVYEAVEAGLLKFDTAKEKFILDNNRDPDVEELKVMEDENVPNGHIPVKIVKSEGNDTLYRLVARYANKQNPINARDQHASDDDQVVYHNLFKGASNYIFFDHKRGKWERTTATVKSNFNVTGQQYRTLDNTKCIQNYLAMIGTPDTAYKGADALWLDDSIVEFVFAKDRTKELQLKTNISSIKSNDGLTANDIYCIREGNEEFAKDMIMCEAITRFVKAIKSRRDAKKKHVKDTLSDELSLSWIDETNFVSYWTFAVIMAFNKIINKHCETADVEDRASKRQEIREALLLGEFWQDKDITSKIFRPPGTWTSWLKEGVEVNNTDYNILPTNASSKGLICKEFPLLGYWMVGVEAAAREVPLGLRNNAKFFKTREFYEPFASEVEKIINDAGKMSAAFPLSVPVDSKEFEEIFKSHKQLYTAAKEFNNKAKAEEAIKNIKDLKASTEAQKVVIEGIVEMMSDDLSSW